jgi:hypothetical protein
MEFLQFIFYRVNVDLIFFLKFRGDEPFSALPINTPLKNTIFYYFFVFYSLYYMCITFYIILCAFKHGTIYFYIIPCYTNFMKI